MNGADCGSNSSRHGFIPARPEVTADFAGL
jgi:hypothetical protein